jgi:murein DD-endopeptidase MepM/ murein hydrolase activator NlpD
MRLAIAIAAGSALMIATTASPADSILVTSRSRSVQPGELVILTLTTPARAADIRVHVFNRDIAAYQVDNLTWRALVGIDLDVAAGAYPAAIDGRAGSATLQTTYRFTVRSKRFPTRTLTVDPAFVNPPAEMEDRIVREAAELEQIWTRSSLERLWEDPFVPPVRRAATSAFGSRSVFNGIARSPHAGADFPSPTGTPIAAPNAGRVVLARDLYFSGNTVVLDHGLGLFSLLAHLSVVNVREGDRISAGQVIGKVGATGRVTGPHLHWAVRLAGARVDPVAVLALLGQQKL